MGIHGNIANIEGWPLTGNLYVVGKMYCGIIVNKTTHAHTRVDKIVGTLPLKKEKSTMDTEIT